MRAIVIAPDAPGGLDLRDAPPPVPSDEQVVIQVRTAGINRADVAQREGRYQQHATAGAGPLVIAGLEVAGVVAQAGRNVSGLTVGDPVMSMCSGGYAEYVAVDHRLALPKPDRLSWAEAAATPVAFITAHDAVVTNGGLRAGERVLVTGGSSVVGLASMQIAGKRGAAAVIGTAGGSAKQEALRAYGFDTVIDYQAQDVHASLAEIGGVDLVVDMIAGTWMPALIGCLNVRGRLVSVGRIAGRDVAFDLDTVAKNRLRILGTSFRTRSMDEYAEVVRAFARDVLPDIATGAMKPAVSAEFPLERARAAQDAMESGSGIGKVVLTVTADGEER